MRKNGFDPRVQSFAGDTHRCRTGFKQYYVKARLPCGDGCSTSSRAASDDENIGFKRWTHGSRAALRSLLFGEFQDSLWAAAHCKSFSRVVKTSSDLALTKKKRRSWSGNRCKRGFPGTTLPFVCRTFAQSSTR